VRGEVSRRFAAGEKNSAWGKIRKEKEGEEVKGIQKEKSGEKGYLVNFIQPKNQKGTTGD